METLWNAQWSCLWIQNMIHVPQTLNQLLAVFFQPATGSGLSQQHQGTSFPRLSALSSPGFAALPFSVRFFQVWVWNREVGVVHFQPAWDHFNELPPIRQKLSVINNFSIHLLLISKKACKVIFLLCFWILQKFSLWEDFWYSALEVTFTVPLHNHVT